MKWNESSFGIWFQKPQGINCQTLKNLTQMKATKEALDWWEVKTFRYFRISDLSTIFGDRKGEVRWLSLLRRQEIIQKFEKREIF